MGIKSFAKKAAIKSADAVAKLSVLSPEQLKSIEYKRMDYLSDLPRPNDEVAQILTERLLAAAGIDIYNEYLEQISNLYVPVERKVEYGEPFIPSFNIRYFEVLLLRIFRIFAGRGAILWTGMSEVVRRRIFRVYSDVSDFILKGNGNRKKIC